MTSYNCFDECAVLDKMAEKINISFEDFEMIHQSLISLAMSSRVPGWGYAGMLLSQANEGITMMWMMFIVQSMNGNMIPILLMRPF